METNKRVINIGEKFGSWTVLDKQGKQVLCRCECENQKLVYSHTLTNGRSTNCGCKKRKQSITVGTTFGRLTVISDVEAKGKRGELLVLTQCSCSCKTKKYISKNSLTRGMTQSCGCLQRESLKNAKTIHGKTKSHEYNSWLYIRSICYDKDDPQYKNYGRYGIEVDPSWRNDFSQFLEDMGPAPEGTVISRINREGGFTPGNSVWMPRKERYQEIHLSRRREIFQQEIYPKPIQPTSKVDISPNVIRAILEAHADGEANINKLAAIHKISNKEIINILLYYA